MEIRFVEQDDRALAQLSQELDSFFFDLLGAVYLEYQPHNTLSGLAGGVWLMRRARRSAVPAGSRLTR